MEVHHNDQIPDIWGEAYVIASEQATGKVYIDGVGWADQSCYESNQIPTLGTLVDYFYWSDRPWRIWYYWRVWDEEKINHEIDWRKEGF